MNTSGGWTTTETCNGCASVIPFGPNTSFDIGGAEYCFECVKGTLDAPINSPAGFPCILNGVMLHPSMFPAPFFGGQANYGLYSNLFDMKNEEWAAPIALRVYCDCPAGQFVGALESSLNRQETTFAGCGSCMKVWCMKCATPTDESAASIRAHLH
jgi:hypothetical protein